MILHLKILEETDLMIFW